MLQITRHLLKVARFKTGVKFTILPILYTSGQEADHLECGRLGLLATIQKLRLKTSVFFYHTIFLYVREAADYPSRAHWHLVKVRLKIWCRFLP